MMGIPAMLVRRGIGTMSSPCPPSSSAFMSSTEKPVSIAMKALNRAMSRQPACPTIRFVGKPVAFHAVYTIASRGFDTMITIAFGACCLMLVQTDLTMLTFVLTRSSRLMPGLRGMPAVTMTTSESVMSA